MKYSITIKTPAGDHTFETDMAGEFLAFMHGYSCAYEGTGDEWYCGHEKNAYLGGVKARIKHGIG